MKGNRNQFWRSSREPAQTAIAYCHSRLSEPTDSEQRGLTGFYTAGTAKDSDIGDVRIAMAWYALNDGTIGEIWFVGPSEDTGGIDEAVAILDSFRSP